MLSELRRSRIALNTKFKGIHELIISEIMFDLNVSMPLDEVGKWGVSSKLLSSKNNPFLCYFLWISKKQLCLSNSRKIWIQIVLTLFIYFSKEKNN